MSCPGKKSTRTKGTTCGRRRRGSRRNAINAAASSTTCTFKVTFVGQPGPKPALTRPRSTIPFWGCSCYSGRRAGCPTNQGLTLMSTPRPLRTLRAGSE